MAKALCLEVGTIHIAPVARAYKRVVIGDEENVSVYVEVLGERFDEYARERGD